MNKKDLLELRRRLKKESCNIDRMAGCYVDSNKNRVLKINESFLSLETEEFQKFLEIARKTLGGTVGNNILELDFPKEEEEAGGKQQFFNGLRSSSLENEELLDRLYDLIIQGYHCEGNYLILLFHDIYDIMTRTSDNMKLDESEEVYEYILVAICPVELSKPGLGYRSDENRIGARIRDWVVASPEIGFLFPAFDDHSSNIHRVDYFIKDPKNSRPEFIEDVLGCGVKRTATEKKKTFTDIVKQAYREDEEKAKEVLMDIQESLSIMKNGESEETGAEKEIMLSEPLMDRVLKENDIKPEKAELIKDNCNKEFAEEEVAIENLIDEKALNEAMKEKEQRELVKKVASLEAELKSVPSRDKAIGDEDLDDVIVNAKAFVADNIRTDYIDEAKYLLIPLDEFTQVRINGEYLEDR